MPDDLVQQLAEVLAQAEVADNEHPWYGWERLHDEGHRHYLMLARAVLASGLMVPTSDVLNLAQQWEAEHRSGLDALMTGSDQYAAELRAITQQEPR